MVTTTRKRGRPTKYTEKIGAQAVAALIESGSIHGAAIEVGVAEQTLRDWLVRGIDEPDSTYGELVRALEAAEGALAPDLAQRPSTAAELNDWFEATVGIRLPSVAVCPGHVAPLEVVWALFNNDVEEVIVLASRSGGKTLLLALLHLANAYWKPGYTTTHFGSVENQAKRAYKHLQEFLEAPAMRGQIADSRMKSTNWRNGSHLEILPGTKKQTQGPHTYLVSWDELESGERQPYENARGIPINDEDGHPWQFITTSTRQ